jgi:hypothetical protein
MLIFVQTTILHKNMPNDIQKNAVADIEQDRKSLTVMGVLEHPYFWLNTFLVHLWQHLVLD